MKNILLINLDEKEDAYFVNALNRIQQPFHYYFAKTAKEGLRLLKRNPIDLVFVNINLPGVNGLLFTSVVRNYNKFRNVKIFVWSDVISTEVSNMAKMLGASGCMERQPNNDTLLHQLKAITDPQLLSSFVFFGRPENARLSDYIEYIPNPDLPKALPPSVQATYSQQL